MPVYEKHVFVCTRGEWCPSIDGDGIGVHAALKEAVRAAGLSDRIRINHAGCFSQCGNGPMAVVYPEGPGTPRSPRRTSPRSWSGTWWVASRSRA